MQTGTYIERRGQLQTYFDRTAVEAWKRLTSDAPVGRIRATVRAGRDDMRRTLLDWLPEDLSGRRILDAGCGTGAFAVEAARRGAHVVAIDLSPTLVAHAQQALPADIETDRIEFRIGDMLDASSDRFDHIVAMDSLIHYDTEDLLRVLETLVQNTRHSVLFTFAPKTAALAAMHTVGRLFPKGDRAPAIEPVSERKLQRRLNTHAGMSGWQLQRTERIASGFYTSQAAELRPR